MDHGSEARLFLFTLVYVRVRFQRLYYTQLMSLVRWIAS